MRLPARLSAPFASIILAIGLIGATTASAFGDSAPLPAQSSVPLYRSVQFDLPSKITGRTYRIFVFKPPLPPPPSGYPVIVVTDANMTFPLAATVDATFAFAGKSAIIVGVGYPTDNPLQIVNLRTRDLTPPTPPSGLAPFPGQAPVKPEDAGGGEDFYRFLVEELRPAIAGAYPVNAGDQTLYGHSLGGLFSLYVLFNHPDSFRNFVASSPSIWWNNRAVLSGEPGFVSTVESGKAAPRVLISIGSREQDATDTPKPGATAEQMAQIVRVARMVDNARELATRLQRVRGEAGYLVQFHSFEGDDHLTALSASVGQGTAFALMP